MAKIVDYLPSQIDHQLILLLSSVTSSFWYFEIYEDPIDLFQHQFRPHQSQQCFQHIITFFGGLFDFFIVFAIPSTCSTISRYFLCDFRNCLTESIGFLLTTVYWNLFDVSSILLLTMFSFSFDSFWHWHWLLMRHRNWCRILPWSKQWNSFGYSYLILFVSKLYHLIYPYLPWYSFFQEVIHHFSSVSDFSLLLPEAGRFVIPPAFSEINSQSRFWNLKLKTVVCNRWFVSSRHGYKKKISSFLMCSNMIYVKKSCTSHNTPH